MVKSGHDDVAQRADSVPVAYQNKRRPGSHLEVLEVSELFARLPPVRSAPTERLDFHLWLLVTRGGCKHMVDFERVHCTAWSVLHVRPGQVHAWDRAARFEGSVLLATPQLLAPTSARGGTVLGRLLDDPNGPTLVRLPRAARGEVAARFEALALAYKQVEDTTAGRELLGHLAAAALLELAIGGAGAIQSSPDERMDRLRVAIDRSFRVTRNVGDYAEALGCAAKTLDRMCRASTNLSAKAFIDARVVLEAKRLLAHSDMNLDAIGAELGFSESTNFAKFFRSRTEVTPGAFRAHFR